MNIDEVSQEYVMSKFASERDLRAAMVAEIAALRTQIATQPPQGLSAENPVWDDWCEAHRLLADIELAQGGSNGPTIRLRGQLQKLRCLPAEQPVALSTLTDELAISQILAAKEDSPAGKWLYDFAKAIERRAASAPAQQAGQGWKLIPVEPTTAMISAMACSKASDAEGEFPTLMDLIDYSGENKTHTVLKAAYQAMLTATPPQPVAAEVDKQKIMFMVYDYARISDGIDSAEGDARRQQIAAMRERANEIRAALSGTGSDESKKGEGNG